MTHYPADNSSWEMEQALSGEQRGRYVARMFGRIARHYDLMNRLMSLGQDQSWRRRMADLARVPTNGLVLDLATGTGDVGLAVLERYMDARVVGADFALPMMQVGRRKLTPSVPLTFVGANALALPFKSETFDAVLHAFLMRNIADISEGFREQWRILKPGGRLICLEIVTPGMPLIRMGYRLFFESFVPKLGAWISGEPGAYSYLPQSVLRFPSPPILSTIMQEAGFKEVRYERIMLGSIAIHVGRKPGARVPAC